MTYRPFGVHNPFTLMGMDRQSLSNSRMAGMMQAEPIDPASRVTCRSCGCVTTLTRFHRIQSIEGICCRGCGAVIGKDGASLASRRSQK